MINWVEKGRNRATADVSIALHKGGTPTLGIIFTRGAIAAKFHNCGYIKMGFDKSCTRLYFIGSNDGYKLSGKNSTTLQVCLKQFEKADPRFDYHSVLGNHELKKDEQENAWYISIGALPR